MKPFTVIGFIDGDNRVLTFVEKVMAVDACDAWRAALLQGREEGHCSIRDHEWDCATEILTLDGHHEPSQDYAWRKQS